MDRLTLMSAFVRTVELGSLSSAARELKTTQPTVSKWLRALEQHTGARLLQRNTQGVSLTEAGERYYETCKRILAELDRASAELGQLRAGLTGRLRINVSVGLGEVELTRIVVRFQKAHPRLKVDLVLTDRVIDLVEEGVDVAVRVGAARDPNVVARAIGAFEFVLVATPEYLSAHGAPRSLDDLGDHPYLAYGGPGAEEFQTSDGLREVAVRSEVAISNSLAVKTAALEHAGIARVGRFLVQEELRAGKLVELLPGCAPPPVTAYAVYLPSRYLPEKIRTFVAFLIEGARAIPGWVPAPPAPIERAPRR